MSESCSLLGMRTWTGKRFHLPMQVEKGNDTADAPQNVALKEFVWAHVSFFLPLLSCCVSFERTTYCYRGR